MYLQCGTEVSGVSDQTQCDAVGKLQIERFPLRLHRVNDFADESLGHQFSGQLAGDDDNCLRTFGRSPAVTGRRADQAFIR